MKDLVQIARIRKPQGIKGEVAADAFVSDPERFKKLKLALLGLSEAEAKPVKILKSRPINNGVILLIEGIEDRNAAEALRDYNLYIPAVDRKPLPEGRAYFDEIIGLTVVDDKTGNVLGAVRDIVEMPGGEVFVLDIDGTEHLLANSPVEVKKIDVEAGQLRVDILEEY